MKNEVLIVATEFPPGPGGIGSHAYSLAKAFHKKGIDVTVIASADYATREQVQDFDSDHSFRIVRYPRKGMIKYIRRFFIVSKHLKQNVILSGKFSLWMGLWLKLTAPNANVISILHGSEVNLPNTFLRRLTHRAIASADKIIAVSNFTKCLLPSWILRKHQIDIIPNGIDLTCFSSPDNPIPLQGNPVILTVGNVTPRKGQHRVIKAMPDILNHYPDAHYHIVGLPSYRLQFSALAKELGVSKAVTFHGRIEKYEDLFSYYEAADIFVILSENQSDGDCEGFGIVVLEAGYFGLPTIGAKGCGIADAVKDGLNGYLVDGDNGEEVCNAMEKIMHNKCRLQHGAKKWAVKHDWNNIVNDFIKLLK